MEEVDKIIIHSLRQIGCDVDESITKLAKFDTELIINASVKCLEHIKPGLGLSPVLPGNMAARFRTGMLLAQAVTELGYRGDVGYQTFLYESEADLRRVLIFLIEKFPKECDKTITEPITKSAQLERAISTAISSQLSKPWLPYYCHKKRSKYFVKTKIPFATVPLVLPQIKEDSKEHQDYSKRCEPFLFEQTPDNKYFLPSIISLNCRASSSPVLTDEEKINWILKQDIKDIIANLDDDVYSLGRHFTGLSFNDEKLACSVPKDSEKEEENKNIIVDNELKAECERLKVDIEELQLEIKNQSSEINKISLREQEEAKVLATQKEQSKYKLKAFELLENGEENIHRLQEAIQAQVNKLLSLAKKWEKHRLPLVDQYRAERDKYSSEASASQKKMNELKSLRDIERELLEECRSKDQQYSQLVTEVQKLPKEVNRAAYTQRILEIINNVRKQKDEINKVLADTREVQKEINTLTGRLERSFAVVDELIFRDARTNESSRRAYKLLATLHTDCSEIVKLVEETGAMIREIRDLEEQIECESSKNVEANLERITADLKQMRQETAALTAQLQSKRSQLKE